LYFIKVVWTLLIFNVLLKVDRLAIWTWLETLWPLYILMLADTIAALVSLYMLLNRFSGWALSRNNHI
jgi:hypothetical protein